MAVFQTFRIPKYLMSKKDINIRGISYGIIKSDCLLKFGCSEKFDEWKIFSNFLAFSEYPKFT